MLPPKSPIRAQHWAWVSCVRQFVPLQTLPALCCPVKLSATLLTLQKDVAVPMAVAELQLSFFALVHE